MLKKIFNKRGIAQAVPVIMALVMIVVLFLVWGLANTYSADIVSDIQDDFTASSAAYNVSAHTLDNQMELAESQSTVRGVVIAGAVIFILVAVFLGRRTLFG